MSTQTGKRNKVRRPVFSPRLIYPEFLPITSKKDEIVRAIKKHRAIVVTGDTGSGKTTQIPKMCIEAGRGICGLIGCTQPRRVAAITVAHRIADELGEEIGKSVGYKIRFEDKTSRSTRIKIMTDGVLLNEAQSDPFLRRYDTIIVDEAHERSLNIDLVLGFLRTLLSKRRDLKVIITSATLDTEKFASAFNAPVIEVSGRTYPVEVLYHSPDMNLLETGDITYVDAAVSVVEKIWEETEQGDVLIFMPTEQDIRDTCETLNARFGDMAMVLPLYARLPWYEQRRVFIPSSVRKIIVATNVAETSITIPGIKYVIDTGLARISQYNPRSRTTSLPVKPISKSSADQRKGRCGRVQDGVCFRLYDREDYESRPLFTEPEILRSNLAEVILRMLALNLGDVSSFPFIDPPSQRAIKDGIDLLKELGAIDVRKGDPLKDEHTFVLTERGKLMASLPIDPRISRMIVEAEKKGCVPEILIISSALSIQDPRERPTELEMEADRIHSTFMDHSSDFISLLRLWRRYHSVAQGARSKSAIKKFCRDHYLSFRRMREWVDVHDQLKSILEEHGWTITEGSSIKDEDSLFKSIHRAILSGFLSHIATKKERNIYTAAKGKEIMIFPGSGLFNKGGKWIVAAELVETSRLFARTVGNIEVEWLEELGGTLCRSSYSEPHWSKTRGEVVAYEQVTLFGLVIVPRRLISYGKVNPEEATEIFIRDALVGRELPKPMPFMIHNKEIIDKVRGMEDKIRRRNLLVGEDEMVLFYKRRLPFVYDIKTLKKIIKTKGSDEFLKMKESDVLLRQPDENEILLYPDTITVNGHSLPCEYQYDPGSEYDGATLKVPLHALSSLLPHSFCWKIPGLLKEQVKTLLKGLPKDYRRKLPPLTQTAEIIFSEMKGENVSLPEALSTFIRERFGVGIPLIMWRVDDLPNHLKVRFTLTESNGREVASSRNFLTLKSEILTRVESDVFENARLLWEKIGVTIWDFGDLPEEITLEKSGCFQGYAYPALEKDRDCVNVRLFKSKEEASVIHREGVAKLYTIYFKDDMKHLKKNIELIGEEKKWADELGGGKNIEHNIVQKVVRDLFAKNIRKADEFYSYAQSIAKEILPTAQEVLKKIKPVLKAYYETSTKIRTLEMKNRFNKTELNYLNMVRDDLRQLVPPDFMILYEDERFDHLVRYLRGIAIRAERGLLHLGKAFTLMQEINGFAEKYRKMTAEVTQDKPKKKKAVDELRWMIEEYKISLFAQEIKTAFPVSRKRLEKKIQEIEECI